MRAKEAPHEEDREASGRSSSEEHEQSQGIQERLAPTLRLMLQSAQRRLDRRTKGAIEEIERQQHQLIAARVESQLGGSKPPADDDVVQLSVEEIDDGEAGQIRAEVETATSPAPVSNPTWPPGTCRPYQ